MVIWISDGDTIEVEDDGVGITIRLLGINAPDDGECYAEEATEYLIEELKGETVGLDGSDLDQFGRTLSSVWHDDALVNLALVESGFAIATTPEGNAPHGNDLLAAEEDAFTAQKGLWSPNSCGPTGSVPDLGLEATATNPAGPDDDRLSEEYVTVINESDAPVPLDQWVLRDESSANRYHFSSGASINTGASLRVSSNAPGWAPGGRPVWNNGGDMLILLDEHGRVVARLRYP